MRAAMMLARVTIEKSDTTNVVHTVDVNAMFNEKHTSVEIMQGYGFTGVPLPPANGKRAEAVVAYLNGDRSHPIVIAHDDRRFRPTGWQPGEVGNWDDQGQTVHLARGGIAINGGASKLPITIAVGNAVLTIADGKITAKVENMVIVLKAARIDLGQDPAPFRMMTEAGPSSKIWGVI